MKILHFHTSLAGGGIEAVVTSLANKMSEKHDVSIATIFKPSDSDVFEKKVNRRVKRYDLGKCKAGFSIVELFKIYKLIKSNDYDVVNIHGFFYYYVISILLLHKKVRFYYTIHSNPYMENSKWDKRLLWLKGYCFRKKLISAITISHESTITFPKIYGCDSFLIPNGIDIGKQKFYEDPVAPYRLSDKTKVLVHPGRITTAKNQLVLCKSVQRMIEDGSDIVLLILGAKQDNHIYDSIIGYFSDRIVYLGEVNNVIEYLNCSDAMCLSSIWEGFPMTLLEALAVGCIPICTSVGGIPDVVVDGYNGILSASVSEDNYYFALKRFIEMDNNTINALRRNCVASVERFSIDNVTSKYLELYSRTDENIGNHSYI